MNRPTDARLVSYACAYLAANLSEDHDGPLYETEAERLAIEERLIAYHELLGNLPGGSDISSTVAEDPDQMTFDETPHQQETPN